MAIETALLGSICDGKSRVSIIATSNLSSPDQPSTLSLTWHWHCLASVRSAHGRYDSLDPSQPRSQYLIPDFCAHSPRSCSWKNDAAIRLRFPSSSSSSSSSLYTRQHLMICWAFVESENQDNSTPTHLLQPKQQQVRGSAHRAKKPKPVVTTKVKQV